MAYVLAGDEVADACIFCKFPSEPRTRWRERLILCATEQAFVIMNRYPYNGGHLMVVPRAHASDLGALSDGDSRALADLLRATVGVAREVMRPHGFNLGMNLGRAAGAGIDQHLHWHVVPRWNGDTNFMPVTGDAKVLSEQLSTTYERLVPAFRAVGEGPE